MASSVWVQLYYEGNDEPKGQCVHIKPAPEDVDDLVKEVKKHTLKIELDHASVIEIFVYPSGTTFENGNPSVDSIDPRKKIADLDLAETDTLVVLAPRPQLQVSYFLRCCPNNNERCPCPLFRILYTFSWRSWAPIPETMRSSSCKSSRVTFNLATLVARA